MYKSFDERQITLYTVTALCNMERKADKIKWQAICDYSIFKMTSKTLNITEKVKKQTSLQHSAMIA